MKRSSEQGTLGKQQRRVACLAVCIGWLGLGMAHAESAADVLARVNGVAITRRDVREIVDGLVAVGDDKADAATRQRYAGNALESLIDLELLYQESQRRGVLVGEPDIDAEIARTKKHFASSKAYAEALRAKGLSDTDVRRESRRTMAVNRLLEGFVWKDIAIKPEAIRDFYDRHREEFRHPERQRCSHILIRVPENAPDAERQRAKDKAAGLLQQLQGGADFAALAKANSDDKGSAARGGDLGYFAAGELQPDFESAVTALAPGQVSAVVSTSLGYHIIQLTDRRAAGLAPLDEVEDRIRAVLTKRERQKRQADLLQELRKQAKIEYQGA